RLSPPRLGDDYRWEDGSTEGYRLVTEPGDYRLRVLAGCDTSWVHYRLTISYVTVKLPRDGYTVPWGETVELRPTFFSDGAVEDLHWEPGGLACDNCPSPEVAPLQSTIYTLYATNEYGCLDSASVEVRVPVDRRIYLPTAFSPNGDGTNDFFYAQGPTLARIAYFYVFDRWGGQVFALENGAIDDPAFGWDGQTNGRPAPPGVYGWALGLVFPDNEVVERSGEIILLR
ncbi:MAG: gliding motility-associated C-terminal domain-containing protein, partial [Lewinella sp.]|nr:gliding motility-associated C-terminal domain-containing protein [Lewinella sp.]